MLILIRNVRQKFRGSPPYPGGWTPRDDRGREPRDEQLVPACLAGGKARAVGPEGFGQRDPSGCCLGTRDTRSGGEVWLGPTARGRAGWSSSPAHPRGAEPRPGHRGVLWAAALGWVSLSGACLGPANLGVWLWHPAQGRARLSLPLGQRAGVAARAPLTTAPPAGSSRSQSVASSPYAPQPPAEPQLKKMEPPSEGKVSGERWVPWGACGRDSLGDMGRSGGSPSPELP